MTHSHISSYHSHALNHSRTHPCNFYPRARWINHAHAFDHLEILLCILGHQHISSLLDHFFYSSETIQHNYSHQPILISLCRFSCWRNSFPRSMCHLARLISHVHVYYHFAISPHRWLHCLWYIFHFHGVYHFSNLQHRCLHWDDTIFLFLQLYHSWILHCRS